MNKFTRRLLYAVYLALLATLLPHTAWAFQKFEPAGLEGDLVSWSAAFAFEAAIAALTFRLALHIEQTPKRLHGRPRLAYQYINTYSLGLVAAIAVSALANLAHAVQFGGSLAIFGEFGMPFWLYAVAFGGVLPFVSLLFARVLSNSVELDPTEEAPNPELEAAKDKIKVMKGEYAQLSAKLEDTEAARALAETRFGDMGDLVIKIFAGEKKQRIIEVKKRWPEMPANAISQLTEASPSFVSETLKEWREKPAEVK